MKKKLIMSTVAMTVMLGFNRLAFADTINNNENTQSSVQSAAEVGAAVKTAAIALKNSDSSGIFETDSGTRREDAVMTIMGKSVGKAYFDYRVSLYSACDSLNPVKDAEDLIKKQLCRGTRSSSFRTGDQRIL